MHASTMNESRPDSQLAPARHDSLKATIERAAELLPLQGPIAVFIAQNTLQALEDMPFSDAMARALDLYGAQPYLTENRYRDELKRGRIRFADLQDALRQDLREKADTPVPCFDTRYDLRLAMLQYPSLSGPPDELLWYVAETDALRVVRTEASSAVRNRLISETRRWVIRDLRGRLDIREVMNNQKAHLNPPTTAGLAELLKRFGLSKIETWTEQDWEGFTLQAMWRVCCDGVRDLPITPPPPLRSLRPRDALLEATGVDTDEMVHEVLIRFCAAFLDQGLAPWPLPDRDQGFLKAFCSLYRDKPPSGPWTEGLNAELARLQDSGEAPLDSIAASLRDLGIADSEREDFLASTLLALRGFAGMIHRIERRADIAVQPVPPGSLVEYLAIRLLLDRFALNHTARTHLGLKSPVSAFWRLARGRSDMHRAPSVEQRAFAIFQLAQVQGFSPDLLDDLKKEDWARLVEEIETFSDMERRRIFHKAYEGRVATQFLDAVTLHAPKAPGRPASPRFQASFCLDDREESFRRHLEEMAPDVETFGVAGFYNVPMYYRGAGDAHFIPSCPVVIRPGHWVTEEVGAEQSRSTRRRVMARKVLGTASHRFHLGTRGFALGAVLTGAVGVLASIPLVARILFPRLTARFRDAVGQIVRTPPLTHLQLERNESEPGPLNGHVGFSLEEMANIGERLLRDIGLTRGFARLVLLHGHSSNSLNNPYNSAYNCGACGGAAGGPNARAMARMLNEPRVREVLAARGLVIPETTVFVGGDHNTCNDTVAYYDLDLIPPTHRQEYQAARDLIDKVCERNAHERCRRFMSAPLTLSFRAAREHVEERSQDLAQTRPELGHATTCITIVGRREWSRGLFLDRRAFLTSYDPTEDDAESSILARILGAVFPVCVGINLQYYFSHVDSVGFGSGSKLPQNLSALVGVMVGAASDLRTGLPWQMVELHEAIRSIFLIETTPETMMKIMNANPVISRHCRNGWVQLNLIDPETRQITVFDNETFVPYRPQSAVLPSAASSVDWYGGWRENLEFAEIPA